MTKEELEARTGWRGKVTGQPAKRLKTDSRALLEALEEEVRLLNQNLVELGKMITKTPPD